MLFKIKRSLKAPLNFLSERASGFLGGTLEPLPQALSRAHVQRVPLDIGFLSHNVPPYPTSA